MATTRRSFTDESKREAVSRLASSGRPLTQVATELGIQPSMLRSWRGAVNGMATATPGPGTAPVPAAASAEQAEIRRLRRELERAQCIHQFRESDEEIELRPILDELAASPPLDLLFSDETETRLAEVVGGLSLALVRCFKILYPDLKNPLPEHWERSIRIFDLPR